MLQNNKYTRKLLIHKHFPKKILVDINNNYPNISNEEYFQYLEYLHSYTLENLTTDKLANYLISKLW